MIRISDCRYCVFLMFVFYYWTVWKFHLWSFLLLFHMYALLVSSCWTWTCDVSLCVFVCVYCSRCCKSALSLQSEEAENPLTLPDVFWLMTHDVTVTGSADCRCCEWEVNTTLLIKQSRTSCFCSSCSHSTLQHLYNNILFMVDL